MIHTFKIALRYSLAKKANKFAFFVALMSTLGIAIGVIALLVVSSIMQGLEGQLKSNVLSTTPHLVVHTDKDAVLKLYKRDDVLAFSEFFEAKALIQSKSSMGIITLQGESDIIQAKDKYYELYGSLKAQNLNQGSFNLDVNTRLIDKVQIYPGDKVRIISTLNARYSPIGLTPRQRNFNVSSFNTDRTLPNQLIAKANLYDVKALFNIPKNDSYYRVYIEDPFLIDPILKDIPKDAIYSTWRDVQGEFFKAVGMERISMSVMLCLIIVVAAFNILSALTMMVSSRKADIAILKTMGLKDKSILTVFMLIGLIYALSGISLGLIIGLPLALNISPVLDFLGISLFINSAIPVTIDLQNIAFIVLGTIALSLLCSIYPAYRATSANAIDNLSHS